MRVRAANESRRKRLKRLLVTGLIGAAVSMAVPGPASASTTDGPDFELPFPC